jgi:hypothetical protein
MWSFKNIPASKNSQKHLKCLYKSHFFETLSCIACILVGSFSLGGGGIGMATYTVFSTVVKKGRAAPVSCQNGGRPFKNFLENDPLESFYLKLHQMP